MSISSDTLQEYSRFAVDVTMHFQGMFLMGAALMQIKCTIGEEWQHRHTLHAHVTCLECTKEIVDERIKLGEATITYPDYRQCPLLYTEVTSLKDAAIVPVELVLSPTSNWSDQPKELSSDAAACMIESNHRQIMSSSYRGRSELIVCPGTRGLDIQEFLSVGFPKLLKSTEIW